MPTLFERENFVERMDWTNIVEVSSILGVGFTTFEKRFAASVAKGEFVPFKVVVGTTTYYRRADVVRYLEEHGWGVKE
jgi:hypothetical protein